jgi:integrase
MAWLRLSLPLVKARLKKVQPRILAMRRAAGVPFSQPWPQDALRHSFASYHLAMQIDNGEWTARQMGHYSTALLFNTYNNLVHKDDAAAWWKIMPVTQN